MLPDYKKKNRFVLEISCFLDVLNGVSSFKIINIIFELGNNECYWKLCQLEQKKCLINFFPKTKRISVPIQNDDIHIVHTKSSFFFA